MSSSLLPTLDDSERCGSVKNCFIIDQCVEVFSQTAGKWLLGRVTRPVVEGCVTVNFTIEKQSCRKSFRPDSTHIREVGKMGSVSGTEAEEKDPGMLMISGVGVTISGVGVAAAVARQVKQELSRKPLTDVSDAYQTGDVEVRLDDPGANQHGVDKGFTCIHQSGYLTQPAVQVWLKNINRVSWSDAVCYVKLMTNSNNPSCVAFEGPQRLQMDSQCKFTLVPRSLGKLVPHNKVWLEIFAKCDLRLGWVRRTSKYVSGENKRCYLNWITKHITIPGNTLAIDCEDKAKPGFTSGRDPGYEWATRNEGVSHREDDFNHDNAWKTGDDGPEWRSYADLGHEEACKRRVGWWSHRKDEERPKWSAESPHGDGFWAILD